MTSGVGMLLGSIVTGILVAAGSWAMSSGGFRRLSPVAAAGVGLVFWAMWASIQVLPPPLDLTPVALAAAASIVLALRARSRHGVE